jgi:alkylation response protein AidB-like acyl-CoA dehydrogenase
MMDFDDTPDEATFRAEARLWLQQHASLRTEESVFSSVPVDADPDAEAVHVQRAREWQSKLRQGGWAGITWPAEHGGRGGTTVQQIIFGQEQGRFDVPVGVFGQAIGMAGPTIIAHGTPEQRAQHLPSILCGEEVWCQLFSEPGAGSDLASLSTRADCDGNQYVVNGQKVWTSSAHYSDWAMLLARTNVNAPKHHGITYFLLDMQTPGIEVRPLRQITGSAHFNEVFLTDVRVPAANVLGPPHEGWRVARTTLANERTLGGGNDQTFDELLRLARRFARTTEAGVRQGLVDVFIRQQLIRYMKWSVQTALSRGQDAGPKSSVLQLAFSQQAEAVGDLAMALQGAAAGLFDYSSPTYWPWQAQFLGQWSIRLGGGTDQIQRNILAERALGLPRDRKTPTSPP